MAPRILEHMFDNTVITDLGGEEVLSFVADRHRTRVQADIDVFVAAAHFADVNNGDALDSNRHPLPGMERSKRLGGPGTPRVAEFACARLAVQIDTSPAGAKYLIADALDVRHRHPLLWARVCSGEVRVGVARKVASATRLLSLDAAGFVDAEVSEYADGRLSWSRFETLLEAKVIAADLEAAFAAEQAAAEARFARVGRSNEHGVKSLYIRGHAKDVIWLDAALAQVAAALAFFGDTDTVDQRRAAAAGILANPLQATQLLYDYAEAIKAQTDEHQADEGNDDALGSGKEPSLVGGGSDEPDPGEGDLHPADNDADDPAPETLPCPTCAGEGAVNGDPYALTKPTRSDPALFLPKVTLYLHIDADTVTRDQAGVARWEGEGPITTAYLRNFLGPRCRFTIRPVIDLHSQAPVDAYEIPNRLREAVHLRSPADVFPFASHTGRGKDLDHTTAYVSPDDGGPPSQTSFENLGPMVRFHHRIRTFGSWVVKQPFPGIFIWRSPESQFFLVDHTGTRRISNRERAKQKHNPDIVVELIRGRLPIDYERVA